MNRAGYMVMALAIAAVVGPGAVAGETHWEKIERLIVAGGESREAAQAADAYLRSMTPEQLVLAGRQCSAAMAAEFPPDKWDMAAASLGFFHKYYPMTRGAFGEKASLWRELGDKEAPAFWRRYLVHMVARNGIKGTLTPAESVFALEQLGAVLQDAGDSAVVREKIPLLMARFLVAAHSRIPAGAGANERLSGLLNAAAGDYMRLFAELRTPVDLKMALLAGMMCLYRSGLSEPEAIKRFVMGLIDDYEGVDCLLWEQLVNYGAGELNHPQIKRIAAEMLTAMPGRIGAAQGIAERLKGQVNRWEKMSEK